jgi:3-deoxy-D-manno-octulosonate 8-phosphate phosphatase KdsC-like HAD superfamily phosphatase
LITKAGEGKVILELKQIRLLLADVDGTLITKDKVLRP